MDSARDVDPDLVRAYRATIYRVLGPPAFDLRVSEYSPALDAWQRGGGVTCSALLTAANPGSRRLSAQSNDERGRALRAQLQGRMVLATEHIDPEGEWPVERGLLVAGLAPDEARNYARTWGQVAWLQMDAAAMPALLFGGR